MKKLRIEIVAQTKTDFALVIAEQTHFGPMFGSDNSCSFVANGIMLASPGQDQLPTWRNYRPWDVSELPTLVVLGHITSKDHIVVVRNYAPDILFNAVDAYNLAFADPVNKEQTASSFYAVGNRRAHINRYINAPKKGTTVYMLSFMCGHSTCYPVEWEAVPLQVAELEAGLVFPTDTDAAKFLKLNAII